MILNLQGKNCEIDINECENQPCHNNGTCSDLQNHFICNCKEGFEGDLCQYDVNECESNPCANEGLCINEVATYSCRLMVS